MIDLDYHYSDGNFATLNTWTRVLISAKLFSPSSIVASIAVLNILLVLDKSEYDKGCKLGNVEF